MSSTHIYLKLDKEQPYYQPRELLSGEFVIDLPESKVAKNVEFSILWHTEGKGNEDVGIHDVRVWTTATGGPLGPQSRYRFETVLPTDPLSYEGVLIKIRWLVRVKAHLGLFRNEKAEIPFQMGNCVAFAEPA
jgi:hypothetical protein